jgi:hypothetical protein
MEPVHGAAGAADEAADCSARAAVRMMEETDALRGNPGAFLPC